MRLLIRLWQQVLFTVPKFPFKRLAVEQHKNINYSDVWETKLILPVLGSLAPHASLFVFRDI